MLGHASQIRYLEKSSGPSLGNGEVAIVTTTLRLRPTLPSRIGTRGTQKCTYIYRTGLLLSNCDGTLGLPKSELKLVKGHIVIVTATATTTTTATTTATTTTQRTRQGRRRTWI